MSVNRNNVSFVMKYGTPAHVDKIIRSDIPHWDDLPNTNHAKASMAEACMDATHNPNLTHAQKTKILKFRGNGYSAAIIGKHMLERHPDLAPEHVEMAAENAKHMKGGRVAIYWHKNTTSKAMQHAVDGAADDYDSDEARGYAQKMGQLQNAGK